MKFRFINGWKNKGREAGSFGIFAGGIWVEPVKSSLGSWDLMQDTEFHIGLALLGFVFEMTVRLP